MLVKYLLGEATEAEQQQVTDWLSAAKENQEHFDQFKLIWDQSRLLAAQSTINVNEAWNRYVARVTDYEENGEEATAKLVPLFQRSWVRIAAMLVLFCGIGWIMYTRTDNARIIMAQSGNGTLTDTLPDGSVVILNKNSSLSYPARFAANRRSVVLKGEAFFSITPDKLKPFIIDANSASVTVVGTTFNVKTSPDVTEVIVETGIVQVAKKERSVQVKPNQKATVVKGKDNPEMEDNTDELYNYYRTKEFVCRATPLRKLVAVLNEAYNVQIEITGSTLADMPLTVTFKDEPLDNILKVIKETLNITVTRKGSSITLSPLAK